VTKFTISSSLFQYSGRTIASTETIETSNECSNTQLYGARKFEGMASSGGGHAYLPQKAYFDEFLQARGGF
jgi:hypothetical protein